MIMQRAIKICFIQDKITFAHTFSRQKQRLQINLATSNTECCRSTRGPGAKAARDVKFPMTTITKTLLFLPPSCFLQKGVSGEISEKYQHMLYKNPTQNPPQKAWIPKLFKEKQRNECILFCLYSWRHMNVKY